MRAAAKQLDPSRTSNRVKVNAPATIVTSGRVLAKSLRVCLFNQSHPPHALCNWPYHARPSPSALYLPVRILGGASSAMPKMTPALITAP